MNRWLLPLMSLVFFANGFQPVAQAARIPIIWGNGETMSEVGELPNLVAAANDLDKDSSVGFLYSHFHIYYLDLWTWNGRHVVHAGDRYWEPTEEQWKLMLGGPVTDKYGTPLLYRLPVGLTLLFSIVVFCSVWPRLFPNQAKQVEKLSKDARYASALQAVFPENDPELRTTADPQRFHSAVTLLTSQGISEQKARRNLEMLVSATCALRESRIMATFESAEHSSAIGATAEAIEILETLIAALPTDDSRRENAVQLLTTLQQAAGRPADAGEEPTPPEEPARGPAI